jgi:transcriptional regulator with XRE-family HTH domain
MSDQLKEIGMRIRGLREILGKSEEEVAALCETSIEEYRKFERGERDFSFSFLHNVSQQLGVDVLDLMSGDSPKLSTCSFVKSGNGLIIERRAAYQYRHLAFTFKDKKADPFMVTVEPNDQTELPQQYSHKGQEFNYMVEGKLKLKLGNVEYILEEGDSIYFDSKVPHAMKAMDGKRARFIAVVMS